MRESRWVIWRPLRPASTRSLVVSVSINVQLPALPLPKIVIRIPTAVILHRAGFDSSFLQAQWADFRADGEAHRRHGNVAHRLHNLWPLLAGDRKSTRLNS